MGVLLQSLLLGSALATYQGPNYRVPYYRNKYGSDEITHVVEFEVSRSGYQGVGAKDALNSEPPSSARSRSVSMAMWCRALFVTSAHLPMAGNARIKLCRMRDQNFIASSKTS